MERVRCRESLFSTYVSILCAAALVVGCSGAGGDDEPDVEREDGQSDFISAGGTDGHNGRGDDDLAAEPADGDAEDGSGGEERTVEEGDIYRLLGDGLILNLNAYRGLQVIDFSDLSDPTIIGRARVTGHPVELYVYGDHAFVLMNDWRGYYGSRFASVVESVTGGLVLSVDISDPTEPEILEHVHVPGSIRTSRLVHGGGQAALYVAAGERSSHHDEDGNWQTSFDTYVRSFEVTGGMITERSELDLGGFVSDIQATSEALLVARNERWWSSGDEPSRVQVIDISSPDGIMVEGDDVEVAGSVFTQFNMDLYGDVLRVVSGSRWGSRPSNYIQTFDASDLSSLTLIDEEEFGEGEDLYATLFLGNKAFFVTYFQVDPFHAFEITDEGIATEMSEFVVSGWNDYFRSVFDETRLIGIGKNDEQGSQQAVSLYDITDLTNPDPLISRAEVDMHWSWSEAQWDHRAFSVLQDAVDVHTEDGVHETGLVLLPFSGWEYDDETGWGRHLSAVQIFTFSENTLTRRGVMEHPSRVRRSFLASSDAVANLSETDLAFFDHQDPDEPLPLGSVELAPDYSDYFVFGDYGVRRKDVGYSWWYQMDADATTHVEVIDVDGDPDLTESLTSFEVDRRAQLFQLNDLLVAIWNQPEEGSDGYQGNSTPTLSAYDLDDPLQPELLATVDISDAVSSTGYWRHWEVHPVGEGVVFVEHEYHSELVSTEEVCRFDRYPPCQPGETCVWYRSTSLDCERESSGEIECTGEVERCEYGEDGTECEVLDISEIDDYEDHVHCWDRNNYRYWMEMSVRPIDLSTPSDPQILPAISTTDEEHASGVLTRDEDVYLIFARPETVPGDDRTFVRWFFQRVDLSSYSSPVVDEPVNVPGRLIAVDGDHVYTRDFLYNGDNVETAVARCEVIDGSAYLRGGIRRFNDRSVGAIQLDGAGNLLVTHGPAWWWWYGPHMPSGDGSDEEEDYKLSVLDAEAPGFPVLSEVEVDRWANLEDARPGRALFRVPGGLLIMNLDEPASPYPQAYFPTHGWPRSIRLLGDDIIMAAGRYGLYRFPIDAFNLLPAL